MWYEYPIPADFDKQKEIIRALRKWIQQLENDQVIEGFAFKHYYSEPQNPKEPDELRVRFQYSDEQNRPIVELELESEVKNLLPNYFIKVRSWDSETTGSHVLQAHEIGSRCAFFCMGANR